jgi:dihydroneopterin aldolase
MTDRIELKGLRARGFHGVFDFERAQGQDFLVDAVLELDLAPAARPTTWPTPSTMESSPAARRDRDGRAGQPDRDARHRLVEACLGTRGSERPR